MQICFLASLYHRAALAVPVNDIKNNLVTCLISYPKIGEKKLEYVTKIHR